MKHLVLSSLMVIILLSLVGCQQTKNPTENQKENQTETQKENPIEDTNSFVEPESSDWVKYITPVREYMYYRTQAVLNNDINILWDKYQDLKDTIDQEKGVNIEKDEVESVNENFELIDANVDIESYERIKVDTINENEVIVLIHGSIEYVSSNFDVSGAEYLLKIFLKYKDKHWQVIETDEYTLSEYKKWVEEKGK